LPEADQLNLGSYLLAGLIGATVGWTELAQRYKDRPTGPLHTAPGALYILVNALAAAGALAFLKYLELPAGDTLPREVAQILLAGASAMAFFRSAFFTMRVGEQDLPLGPALILQVILNAADRAYDRLRAAERSAVVARIMREISFDRARRALPAYCLKLMQNVTAEEADRLSDDIEEIAQSEMGPRSKSYNLGLLLLTLVGEDTLETAVRDLGGVIAMPNDADLRLLNEGRRLPAAEARRVLFLCRFLEPDAVVDGVEAELETVLASTDAEAVKVVAILAILRRVFGSAVLEVALQKRLEGA
jgi:hypothetical protein